jgi:Xaa-Pro aminopeptidase
MDRFLSDRCVAYRGDAELQRLLAEAGSPYGVTALEGLVLGALAAPSGTEWHKLVAPEIPPVLAEQLDAFAQLLSSRNAPTKAPPEEAATRLARLRAELARRSVDGFIVPRGDEHQGEYVPKHAQRLAWLTGFTGSAGLAVVLADRAALFVDGRYTLQAAAEVDSGLYELRHMTEQPAAEWLAAVLKPGQKVGYDPWLHTPGEIERLGAGAARAGALLASLEGNPIDAVWLDQPPPPLAPVVPHPLKFAGKPSAEKREEIAAFLAKGGVDAVVLTQPDSIAWLLDIRGGDVEHTPLPLAFALLRRDARVELFIDRRKLLPGLDAHLGSAVAISDPEALGAALDRLGREGKRVQADPAAAASWIFDRLGAAGATIHRAADPCQLAKAVKNAVELDGIRAAHRRDGAALSRFLAFLDAEAPKGTLGEIAASDRLEAFRRDGPLFRDLSFPTISGAGPNGAIVHYRATPATERRITPDMLYLLDSGAQYLDGTTDVTRTIAIGTPDAEMKDRFTRVLKGHIAIATCRFPAGTTGSQLDALARHALWQAGLDYDHGTGHGVGAYLGVHEGPQRISKVPNSQALLPGMIVSNEPGYYKTGHFGIRIENLVLVTRCAEIPGAERETLCFETLTLVPIDRRCIEPSLLSPAEIAWLDAYHERVRAALMPLLDGATAGWLKEVTKPLWTEAAA